MKYLQPLITMAIASVVFAFPTTIRAVQPDCPDVTIWFAVIASLVALLETARRDRLASTTIKSNEDSPETN